MVIDSNNFSRIKFVHDELHLMTCKLSCCTCEHTQSCHDQVCVIILHLVLLSSCHMTSCNLHMVIHTSAHIPPYRYTITSNTGFKMLSKVFKHFWQIFGESVSVWLCWVHHGVTYQSDIFCLQGHHNSLTYSVYRAWRGCRPSSPTVVWIIQTLSSILYLAVRAVMGADR